MNRILYSLLFAVLTVAGLNAQTIYVSGTATGDNDGTTWANAFTSLDAALESAEDGDAIWVTLGIYTPDSTYQVSNDVSILGGFAGVETEASAADPVANPTTLSGDRDGDDIPGDFDTNRDDNTRIMEINGGLSMVVVSGFTFSGGKLPATVPGDFINDYSGAGILCYSPAEITECSFVGNDSDYGAGIAFLNDGVTEALVSDITAIGNKTDSLGVVYANGSANISVRRSSFNDNNLNRGCIYMSNTDGLTVDSCSFDGNSATARGTGIGAVRSIPVRISNSSFTNNTAADHAPGVYFFTDDDTPADPNEFIIESCNFENNTSSARSGAIYMIRANSTIRDCIFKNNTAATNRGGAIYFNDRDGTIHITENTSFENNTGGIRGNNIYQQGVGHLTFTGCEFLNNGNLTTAGDGGAILINGESEPEDGEVISLTIDSCRFIGNLTNDFGGAIYANGIETLVDVNITNSEFSGNRSFELGGAFYIRNSVNTNVNGSLFSFNEAPFGGALYLREFAIDPIESTRPYTTHSFTNSTFNFNTALGQGGAVDIRNANADFTNCIFSKNLIIDGPDAETFGAGGAIIANGDSGIVTVVNLVHNTFFENTATKIGDDLATFLPLDAPAGEGSLTVNLLNNAFTSESFTAEPNGNVAIESGQALINSLGGNFYLQEPTDSLGIVTATDIVSDGDDDPEEFYVDLEEDEELDFNLNTEDFDNPLVDAGVASELVPATDFEGQFRDDLPDIGAHEVALPTVAQIIADSEVHTSLAAFLVQAGLVSTLNGEGPFTVFAPTDDAFAALSQETLDLLGIGDNLTNTLLTHVVDDEITSDEISDGFATASLAPQTNLEFDTDGGVTVTTSQGAVANVTVFDLMASNGVVHVIDAVLIPAIVAVNDFDAAGIDVQFFPNPIQDQMNVQINELDIDELHISVVDMNGRRLNHWSLENGSNVIDFSRIPAGAYTLEIVIDGVVYGKRVVKR